MENLDYLLNQLEPLNLEENGDIRGGYIALELSFNQNLGDDDTNYFQCGCNNYQCGKTKDK